MRMKITWKRQSTGNDKYRSPTSTMKAKVEEQEEFRGRKALDSSDGPSTQQLADSFQAQGDSLSEVGVPDVFSHRQVVTPDLVLSLLTHIGQDSNISAPSDSYQLDLEWHL